MCKACRHPQRDAIDRQMIKGVPYSTIVASTGLSLGGLSRHKPHIREALVAAIQAEQRVEKQSENEQRGYSLLDRVERLVGECEWILGSAKGERDLRAATAAIAAATKLLEMVGRLSGELSTPQNLPGIHLTMNRVTTTTINIGDDTEIAALVGEATHGFDVGELMRLKGLVEQTPTSDSECNDHATR